MRLGCSTANALSPRRDSIAGSFHRRRSAFICASAWPMASACSGSRCRAQSASTSRIACPDMSILDELFTTTCDWRIASLGWMYTLFFVVLGSAGGALGRLARARGAAQGRRCRGVVLVRRACARRDRRRSRISSGCCGSARGVIGGIGLGLGYISPVSTLVKWFPDRRGMATGMAIMGFGGGAMIGAPLANLLMNYFRTPTSVGVWETFLAMAAIYFVFMMVGAFGYRIPPTGWRPEGWTPPSETKTMITQHQVASARCAQDQAVLADLGGAVSQRQRRHWRDRHGVADVAGNLRRLAHRPTRRRFRRSSHPSNARLWRRLPPGSPGSSRCSTSAAGSSGPRSPTISGARTPTTRSSCSVSPCMRLPPGQPIRQQGAVRAFFCIILSMYGGGFATVPAYLADIFGTQFVGAIHGRLLTAWSTAGIVGPVVVNYIREFEIAAGVSRDHVYDVTMYVLAGMLVGGFVCNFLVKPLADKWFMKPEEVAALQAKTASGGATSGSFGIGKGGLDPKAALFWCFVGIPIAWGVWITLKNAIVIFQ